MSYMNMTREFITAMGQDKDKDILEYENTGTLHFRLCLLKEEMREVEEAADNLLDKIYESYIDGTEKEEKTKEVVRGLKRELLKELCDLQYVLSGFAVTFGLPFDEAFRRVHESNMSKLGPDGKPIYREDGKVLKGPNYKKPDLSDLA